MILDTSSRTQLRVFSFSSETSHSVLFIPFPPVAHFLDFAALGSSYDFLLCLLWFVFYTRFLCRYGEVVGGGDGVRGLGNQRGVGC